MWRRGLALRPSLLVVVVALVLVAFLRSMVCVQESTDVTFACGEDVAGVVTSISGCQSEEASPDLPPIAAQATHRRECRSCGFVSAAVALDLGGYLTEVEHLVGSLGALGLQPHMRRQLSQPMRCTICLCAECMGDDVALRNYVLSSWAGLPFDVVVGLPPIRPDGYSWLDIDHDMLRPLFDPVRSSRTAERSCHNNVSGGDGANAVEHGYCMAIHDVKLQARSRIALATHAAEPCYGGGPFSFSQQNAPHMRRLFQEVVEGYVWRLPFDTLAKLQAEGRLLESWWSHCFAIWGWIFGWRADIVLLSSRSKAAAAWAAQEYDVMVFPLHPSTVELLPFTPGLGPVRVLMPGEPRYLINWAVGGEGVAAGMPASWWRRRLAAFMRLNGVCPIVFDPIDLPWVATNDAYCITRGTKGGKDDPCALRGLDVVEGQTLPSDLLQLAPLLFWPTTPRWLMPELKHHAYAAAVRRPEVRTTRGVVMLGLRTLQPEWTQQELEVRGFTVVREGFMQRRHGHKIYLQPRAFSRSLAEHHLPILAGASYVVYIAPDLSPGQLVGEAALLGVIAVASPNKRLVRVLLPPELHATTPAEAVARLDELESLSKLSLRRLRVRLRRRARQVIGEQGVPPLLPLLRTLATLRSPPGVPSLPIASLCAPPNTSGLLAPSARRWASASARRVRYWLFAAGRTCGDGSRWSGDVLQSGPAGCAGFCRDSAGCRAFVFDEALSRCSIFSQCRIGLPMDHTTDVFVLDGDGTAMGGVGWVVEAPDPAVFLQ